MHSGMAYANKGSKFYLLSNHSFIHNWNNAYLPLNQYLSYITNNSASVQKKFNKVI